MKRAVGRTVNQLQSSRPFKKNDRTPCFKYRGESTGRGRIDTPMAMPRECAASLPWELQREGSGRPRWVWPDDHMQIALKSIRLMISTPSLNQSKQFCLNDKQSCPGRPPTCFLKGAFLGLRIQPRELGETDVGCGRGEAGRRPSARAEAIIHLGVLISGYVLFFSFSLREA